MSEHSDLTEAPTACGPGVFMTLLAYLYLDNYPDRRGFTGTRVDLLQWGHRMGLASPEELEAYQHIFA